MNPLIKRFGLEKRFVNWRLLQVKGRVTKVPYQTNGKKASSTVSSTWSLYEDAKKYSPNVGIVLHDKKLICIDLDHVLVDGKLNHADKEIIADLILEADSYVEISQSGSGLHIFFEVTEPFILNGNRKGIYEIYDTGRYIALTENCYGEPKEVRRMIPSQVTELLKIISYPWKKESKEKTVKNNDRIPIALSDEKLLRKMFESKNGNEIEAVYNGHDELFDGNTSSADMALCSHLAFWTGKNPEQMERLWLNSPLGNRVKTQERKDYRNMTIKTAIDNCTEAYSVPAAIMKSKNLIDSLDLLYKVNREKERVYLMNTENVCRIIERHPDFKNRFRYDEFRTLMEIRPLKTDAWRPLQDADLINIQTAISIAMPPFAMVNKNMVYDAIIKVSCDNMYNSAQAYLTSVVWDKKPRLNKWLCSAFGVKDTEYHVAVGSNWLKGLVKRIMEPGCKFDYVLVLEGPQGCKKSSSLTALGGGLTGWHLETIASTDNKDFFMQFMGKAIIEFAEGETFSRTEVRRMKGIISMLSDKYRVPWGKVSQDFPRHCVFAMSTNETEYLKDDTGNRRWLPVRVVLPEADVQWIIDNRDQLMAEAYYRVFIKKETIYDFPKDETLAEQGARQMEDPNTDATVDWYHSLSPANKDNGVTAMQAYRDVWCGGYINKPIAKYQEIIIGNIFRSKLGLTKRRVMIEAVQANRWFDDSEGIKIPSVLDPKTSGDTIAAADIENDAGWNR